VKRWWLGLVCIVLLLPLYFLLKGSFESAVGLIKMPPSLLLRGATLKNYRDLINGCALFVRWVVNTAGLVAGVGCGAAMVTMLAGYAFAQKPPGHMVMFWAVVASAVIPGLVLVIPRFITLVVLHVPMGLTAALLPLLYSPIIVLMARAWVLQIGREYVEQARLEGTSELGIVLRIIMPMSTPIIGMVVIFQGIGALGDYMWQSMVLRWPEQQTVLVGMMEFMSWYSAPGQPNPQGMRMAMGVVLMIPMVAVFTVGHRWFVGEGKGLEW